MVSLCVGSVGLVQAVDPTQAAKKNICDGISGQVNGDCNNAGSQPLNNALVGILRVLSFIAGFAAIVMIIISGLKYITAGGDSSKISSAKSTLVYAIVGLVIVALSQFLVRFVLNTVR